MHELGAGDLAIQLPVRHIESGIAAYWRMESHIFSRLPSVGLDLHPTQLVFKLSLCLGLCALDNMNSVQLNRHDCLRMRRAVVTWSRVLSPASTMLSTGSAIVVLHSTLI